jgi:hypothetical protein
LQEDDGKQNHQRREVNPAEGKGEPSPNRIKYWFRNVVDKTNNGIIGVRTYPGKDRPGNDKPHIKNQSVVKYSSQCVQKIPDDKHGTPCKGVSLQPHGTYKREQAGMVTHPNGFNDANLSLPLAKISLHLKCLLIIDNDELKVKGFYPKQPPCSVEKKTLGPQLRGKEREDFLDGLADHITRVTADGDEKA